MQFSAPAKINLSLRVQRRRQDGFHEIETFIVPIDLGDELTIEANSGGFHFDCDDPTLPGDDTNLVVKAARRFFDKTGSGRNVRIALRKQIPHGAGLGGGSSDAATTLLGLNRFFQAGLTTTDLAQLGAEIGSDVPFFLYQSAAWCQGRGELVRPEPFRRLLNLVLLKPDFGVPASTAYNGWADARELPGCSYQPQTFGDFKFFNDLEKPVFEKFPILAELKSWLLRQAEVGVALMSGSGSTMFAVLRDEKMRGEDVIDRARAEIDPMLWGAVSKTIG